MKLFSLVLSFLIVLFAFQALAQEFRSEQFKSFAERFISLIQGGDYQEAANLFHYPADYSRRELDLDREGVELGLRELSNLFGRFEGIEVVQGAIGLYLCAVGGGNLRYWEKFPKSIEVKYETTFSKEGKGFLILQIVRISDNPEIKSVAFGIRIDSPNAKERIEKIYMHMGEFMKQIIRAPKE